MALVYVVMLAVDILSGYSVTAAVPEKVMRVQIVDGSGISGMTRRVLDRLNEVSDIEMTIEVVDKVRFDLRDLPRSFIIAREEDQSAARLLAERLGLDPDEVTDKPLENNSRYVTTTLVLGQDAQDRMFIEKTNEER